MIHWGGWRSSLKCTRRRHGTSLVLVLEEEGSDVRRVVGGFDSKVSQKKYGQCRWKLDYTKPDQFYEGICPRIRGLGGASLKGHIGAASGVFLGGLWIETRCRVRTHDPRYYSIWLEMWKKIRVLLDSLTSLSFRLRCWVSSNLQVEELSLVRVPLGQLSGFIQYSTQTDTIVLRQECLYSDQVFGQGCARGVYAAPASSITNSSTTSMNHWNTGAWQLPYQD